MSDSSNEPYNLVQPHGTVALLQALLYLPTARSWQLATARSEADQAFLLALSPF